MAGKHLLIRSIIHSKSSLSIRIKHGSGMAGGIPSINIPSIPDSHFPVIPVIVHKIVHIEFVKGESCWNASHVLYG